MVSNSVVISALTSQEQELNLIDTLRQCTKALGYLVINVIRTFQHVLVAEITLMQFIKELSLVVIIVLIKHLKNHT